MLNRFITSLIFFTIITGCIPTKEINIGFVANLSANSDHIGIRARNGAVIATDEFNLSQKKVQFNLFIKDDQGNSMVAANVDKDLIEKHHVKGIVGHITSNLSASVREIANDEKTVIISPTISTNLVSGIDDYFIRLVDSSTVQAQNLKNVLIAQKNKKIIIVQDAMNKEYTETFYNEMKNSEALQLEVIQNLVLPSRGLDDIKAAVKSLKHLESDAIVLVTSAFTSAKIIQQLKSNNIRQKVYVAFWSYSQEFFDHLGRPNDLVQIEIPRLSLSHIDHYQKFKQRYSQRFKHDPDLFAILSYEATKILIEAIAKNPNLSGRGLIDEIVNRKYQGMLDDFFIDQFGDGQMSWEVLPVGETKL